LFFLEKLLASLHNLPVIGSIKRLLKIAAWLATGAVALVLAVFLLFFFEFLPHIDHYRPRLEQELKTAIGRDVSIARLSGQWDGLAPRLDINGLSIANPHGAPLTLDQIQIKPSWLSLLTFEPRLSLIELNGPSIDLIRGHDGVLSINGFPIGGAGGAPQGSGNANLGNWLLRQPLIQVVNARISWQDQLLDLPRLTLDQGQLSLGSGLFGHTIEISGRPAASVGDSVELSGSWRGDDTRTWNTWNGSLSAVLRGARVNAWNKYLDSFGVLRAGEGDGSFDVAFSGGHIDSLQADIEVKNAAYTPPGAMASQPSAELNVPVLGGKLSLDRGANGYRIDATHLTLMSQSGLVFDNTSISGDWNTTGQGGGDLKVDNVNLSALGPFLHALGVDRNPLFNHFSPSGQVRGLTLNWTGRIEAPTRYRIETAFDRLAWRPFGQVPGVNGVSGSVKFDQDGGLLVLDQASQIQMPHVFPKPLPFTSLNAEIAWHLDAHGLSVDFNKMKFANADLSGWLSGHYQYQGTGAGLVDLKAGIDRVDAVRVVDYLPYAAGASTIHWLGQSLRAGTLSDVSMQLTGDLDRFPFKGGQGGVFKVAGTVHDGKLLFDREWPVIEQIEAALIFNDERMDILSSRAQTLGLPLDQVKVSIPDLGAVRTVLQVNGKASGALQDMLGYTVKSPVDGWLSGLTGKARASGQARLDLGLVIPLSQPISPVNPVRVDGKLHFQNNRLELTSLPLTPMDSVNGDLGFSERGVSSNGVHFNAFGGPFTLTAQTDSASRMQFLLNGSADSNRVFAAYVPALASFVSGVSHYQSRFTLHNGLEGLQVSSDLAGTQLNAPAPLGKSAAQLMPFSLSLLPSGRTADSGLRLDFSLGAQTLGQARLGGHGELQSAEVAIGQSLSTLPPSGLLVKLAMPVIDVQSWVNWSRSAPAPAGSGTLDMPLHLELSTPDLGWGSYHLTHANVWIGHVPPDSGWHAMIESSEVKGEVDYSPLGNGMIRARLPLFVLNFPSYRSLSSTELSRMQVKTLPALDIRIGSLMYKGNSLGNLAIGARYVNQDWLLDSVRLRMPEGVFNGEVRVLGAGSTESRFSVETQDAGKMLERFGIKDTFRKGEGKASGELSWPGGLTDFDLASASGRMGINLENGRFAKVDPGVARLLGVISLQSLSRRIRFDFTDVFSEGFSFDTLKGNAVIKQGIFKSDDVMMKGPGADVQLKGELNLASETEDLLIHVEPHLAEGVAIATGAALVNPVFGVAALAAQKVFQDPMSKLFAVDYHITGTLNNPVVTKLKSPIQSQLQRLKP
jgi:uncharacterized protein (TIGR02099 family)